MIFVVHHAIGKLRRVASCCVGFTTILACAATGIAQAQAAPPAIAKSQRALVQQRIANTWVTVNYSRPVARGRDLYGGIVPFGKVWNPGADTATSIAFSTAVRVNGQALASGWYSIWAEPGPDKWTVIFSRAYPVFHVPYPKGKDALRLTVIPRTGAHMETLAFYFPVVEERHAELVLHWGTVVIPLAIDVP